MSQQPKNILFILSDDQGAWAMRCAGTPELITPNLDRLAREGAMLNNFFCASPVCSPARASLLTGLPPSGHGVHDWLRSGNLDKERYAAQGAENPYGGYRDEVKPIQYLEGKETYTDALARAGVTCALCGKWHLGDSVQSQHGFSKWFTLGKGGCWYYHPDIVENGDIHVLHGQYVTDVITDRALALLDELSDAPFYLSVHYTAPHDPWSAEHHPKETIALYEDCDFASVPDEPDHPDLKGAPVHGTEKRRENLRGYFAAITKMDENIGRLLSKLEEKGILDDTLVIFTADNGMSMGHHGVWGKGNGTFPMNMYDSAVKVPFLARYPAAIRPGTVVENLISACDVFPTLLESVHVPETPDARRPGKSFWGVLTGAETREDADIVICDEYGPVRMLRTRTHKYVRRYPYGADELYDLAADPGEKHNRIDDPAYQELALAMFRRLEAWFTRYADPALDGARQRVYGSGQYCKPGADATRTDVYAK